MEDLIRRQEAIERLCQRCQICNDGMCEEGDCIDLKLIRLVPSVDAIPLEWVQKWIADHYDWDFVSRQKYREPVEYMLKDWAEQRKEE